MNVNTSVIGVLEKVSIDERRTIEEFNGFDFRFQRFTVHQPNAQLGKWHFHRELTETFCITQGDGTYNSCPINADGERDGEFTVQILVAGSVVHIPPMTAHLFVLSERTIMCCYGDRPYNPDVPDMTTAKF